MSVLKEGFVLEVVRRYEGDQGMLIPMMQDLQAEYGYLPPEELARLARELGVPLSRVYGVAMFYSSFRLAPKGLHEVTLCMGTVCYLKGSPKISEAICLEYGIKPGGTTPDRLFTLQAVNCVGACALAPVMIVDGKYYDGVTPDSALEVLRGLAAGEQVPPAAAPEPPATTTAASAPQAAPEPAPEPPATATAASAPQAAPEPAPKAAGKPKAVAKAKPAAKPKVAAKAKTAAKPKAAAKTKTAARPKAAAKPKPKATKKRSRP